MQLGCPETSWYFPCIQILHSDSVVPRKVNIPAPQILHSSLSSVLNFPGVQFEHPGKPVIGVIESRAHVVQEVSNETWSAYCPARHGMQTFLSITVHLGEDIEWPDPFSSSSAVFFKLFDPVLQHRTREVREDEPENVPFDLCQLALHNTCLNAVAS